MMVFPDIDDDPNVDEFCTFDSQFQVFSFQTPRSTSNVGACQNTQGE